MSRTKSYSENTVLENAMHVFWENGYEATSVRLLEKEMGINQFSIYASFKNKKTLFIRSLKQYKEYVKIHVFKNLLQENAGLTDLEFFLYQAAESDITHKKKIGCFVVNTTAELGNSDEEITQELQQYYQFIFNMLKNVLTNAIRKKEIPLSTNVEQQANFFIGVMQSVSVASKTINKQQLTDFIKIAINQVK